MNKWISNNVTHRPTQNLHTKNRNNKRENHNMYNIVAHVEEHIHASGEQFAFKSTTSVMWTSLVLSKVGNQTSLPFWYVVLCADTNVFHSYNVKI